MHDDVETFNAAFRIVCGRKLMAAIAQLEQREDEKSAFIVNNC